MSPFAKTMFSPTGLASRQAGRARSIAASVQSHMAVINAVCLALVAVFTILYVMQINQAVTRGYQIRDLEASIHDLTLANQQLEVTARQGQSLDRITMSMKMLGMVPSGTPSYVEGGEPSYALAK